MFMETVTVSPKYQVVIPQTIRHGLNIKVGEKLTMIKKGRIIYLVPVGSLMELRGFAKGVSLSGVRDERERFA